jgi:hypothetical protein
MAGQKIGTLARNAAVRMPSRFVVFQRCPPSRWRNSRVVKRPRLERGRKIRDPVVVGDELFFARVGVVHAIDSLFRQRRIVRVRRSDVVVLTARLVQIVVEVRASRHQTVDVAMKNQVGDHHPQAARRQRSRHSP